MGILALANMVPQTGPESQWTAANFTSTRLLVGWFLIILRANVSDSSSLVLKAFWDV